MVGKISTAIFDVVAIVLIGIHIPNSIFNYFNFCLYCVDVIIT